MGCIHAIPTCYVQPSYPSMQLANQRPQSSENTIAACSSLDKLSQHAVSQSETREVRHAIPACNRNQSQIGKARHTIPA